MTSWISDARSSFIACLFVLCVCVCVCVCVCTSIIFFLHECVLTVLLSDAKSWISFSGWFMCIGSTESIYFTSAEISVFVLWHLFNNTLRNAGESGGQTHTETEEETQDGGAGGIDEYLNLFFLSSSFFMSCFYRHTAGCVKQTHCVLLNCFTGCLLSYIAFLAKNSGAVKHLHLPPAHSLPLQAVWVLCRQRACYLWTIINIQDKLRLWHAGCSVPSSSIKPAARLLLCVDLLREEHKPLLVFTNLLSDLRSIYGSM